MAPQGNEVVEPLYRCRDTGFKRASDAAVKLATPLHQEVLIDDILQQGLSEAELSLEPGARLLIDQLGIEENIDEAAHLCRVAGNFAKERRIETWADDGGLLGERTCLARQPIEPGEQQALDIEGDFGHAVTRDSAPA